jgi:subtilisin-like proprotein convertase family protein
MMGDFTLTHPQEVQSNNLKLFSSSSTIAATIDLKGLRVGVNIVYNAAIAD